MVEGLRSGDEARHLLAELERAHARLAEANGLVMESLHYARRIQRAVLRGPGSLRESGLEVAVLWEPLHVVGGDYFWIEEIDGLSIVVVADCTGHGVPGAFLTLIVATALDRILHDGDCAGPTPSWPPWTETVRARLRQDREESDLSDDGLDCGICVLDRAAGTLDFAGGRPRAHGPVGGRGRADQGAPRHGLGYRPTGREEPFSTVSLPLGDGATFYLMTDGVSDQMGGTPGASSGIAPSPRSWRGIAACPSTGRWRPWRRRWRPIAAPSRGGTT